ncbi:MAG: glycosyltransferase family 61 protein [Cyanobacteria bacterium K_Offshore_surface_m2_239]|nr:glycosyltransferase family 61 protein [Cyanobacteria bacterium K_Offshore_surface_m2_239]
MARRLALSPGSLCNLAPQMRNLWNLPLERLQIYCEPYERPGDYYKVSLQASCNGADWIGLERYLAVIEETIPFRLLSPREVGSLLWSHLQGPIEEIPQTACVLIDFLNRSPNYFHWFLDALPRIFAAEHHEQQSGIPCTIVVPASLQSWQRDSLRFLNISQDRILQIRGGSPCRGFSFNQLISTFSHRHIRHSPTGHFDAFSPTAIQALADRLTRGAGTASAANTFAQRIYVSRGNVQQRRVRNEEEVMTILSRYGFVLVCLENLSLQEQITLFRNASHVIASHGGALTNLLHVSPGCQVLEIFQSGHGMRPDFFQLAALKGATYSFCAATSLNSSHDIEIPAAKLRSFLEASL